VRPEAEAGNRREEVEDAGRSVASAVDEHEPAPAGPGQRALGDPRREPGRDARVDRVPARREDLRSRVRRQRVAGGDGALHGTSVTRVCQIEKRRRTNFSTSYVV
jgi:hypothetical protein